MTDRVAGHRPRKRFGQHFLSDPAVVHAIVDAIAPRDDDRIVEIGPGLGVLTDALLERVDAIDAVEIDRDLAARLQGRYTAGQLRLHRADALTFDFIELAGSSGARLRVLGNLPYNISSPLLIALLAGRHRISDQHFMLQAEVVRRIVADVGGSDYGRLSVLMQAFYQCEALFEVPPEAFDPPPRVDSAIVRMAVRRESEAIDPGPLQRLLAVAFGQRRKMLRGTLFPWLAQHGVDAPEIDPTARAESVPVDVWIALAARLPRQAA